MAKKETWIKLHVDHASQRVMRKIMSGQDGFRTYCIYQMMQVLGWNIQSGTLSEDGMPYDAAEIAAEIQINVTAADVMAAVATLSRYGLAELVEVAPGVDAVHLPVFEERALSAYQQKIELNEKRALGMREKRADDDKKAEKYAKEIEDVVSYLNTKTGKKYKTETKETRSAISARLREGYTVDDIRKVIDYKADEWGFDPKMQEYLRPKTLFRASNFEGYLQAAEAAHPKTSPEAEEAWEWVLSVLFTPEVYREQASDRIKAAVRAAGKFSGIRDHRAEAKPKFVAAYESYERKE